MVEASERQDLHIFNMANHGRNLAGEPRTMQMRRVICRNKGGVLYSFLSHLSVYDEATSCSWSGG